MDVDGHDKHIQNISSTGVSGAVHAETDGEFFCFRNFLKLSVQVQVKNGNQTQNSNLLKFNNEK